MTAADLAGLGPEDLRLATAEEGDPYLVGLEDEPAPTESPPSQKHLDRLYEAHGVAEEPWERQFWREAEQQRGRASTVIDPAPARKPTVVQPAAVLENVVLTAADENPTGPSRQSLLPPIPPPRPRAPTPPSVPDPRYYGAERPPDRLQAVRARPPVPVGLTARDMDLIARTALGEARGEPTSIRDAAMAAVQQTLRERWKRAEGQYGFTPAEIALKNNRDIEERFRPYEATKRPRYQYDANNPHRALRKGEIVADPKNLVSTNYASVLGMLPGDPTYENAVRLAYEVFTGARPDTTDGATHFVGGEKDPQTGRLRYNEGALGNVTRTGEIGAHRLYRAERQAKDARRDFPYPYSYPGF